MENIFIATTQIILVGVMRNKMASCQQSSMIETMYVALCV